MDCQTEVKAVEQQFKYTQPSICRNPVCSNRSRFMLEVDKSEFVDFQKVIVQETQSELPRGCIPRSVEIVLREETVETVQAGGRSVENFLSNIFWALSFESEVSQQF